MLRPSHLAARVSFHRATARLAQANSRADAAASRLKRAALAFAKCEARALAAASAANAARLAYSAAPVA